MSNIHDLLPRPRQIGHVVDPPEQRGHLHAGIADERSNQFADRPRIDQRLVALDVDDDVAVQRGRHFREPVGAGLVGGFGEAHLAAKIVDRRGDAEVVSGHDDPRHQR